MKPGRGRNKGSGFEREVAKMIVDTFDLKKTECYRTPMSGGHRYASKKDPGDLVLSARARRVFPFSVECKFYKKVDLWPFLEPEKKQKKSWPVRKWIAQTVAACNGKRDVHPLLVFKQNNSSILAVLPELMPLVSEFRRRTMFRYNKQVWYLVKFVDLLKIMKKGNGKCK